MLNVLKQRLVAGPLRILGSPRVLAIVCALVLAGAWLCQALAADTVLWYYLAASYLLMVYCSALEDRGDWFVFVRDTATATMIGMLLVLLAAGWVSSKFDPLDGAVSEESAIQAARTWEMGIVLWHERLKFVGEAMVYLLPLVLLGLVLAGRAAAAKWAEQINRARWLFKFAFSVVTVVFNFTMFTSDQALGEQARSARQKIVVTVNRIDEKAREKWLDAARLNLENAGIDAIANSPSLKHALAMQAQQALRLTKAGTAADAVLLETMGRTIGSGSPLGEAGAAPGGHVAPGKTSHGIAPEAALAMSPKALGTALDAAQQRRSQAQQQFDTESARHKKGLAALADEIERDVGSDGEREAKGREEGEQTPGATQALAKDSVNDLIKKWSGFTRGAETLNGAISKFIGESLHVPESMLKLAIEPVVDKLIDVGYDKVTEFSFGEWHKEFLAKVDAVRPGFLARFNGAINPADAGVPARIAGQAVQALAGDIPRKLLDEAEAIMKDPNSAAQEMQALTEEEDRLEQGDLRPVVEPAGDKITQAEDDLNAFGSISEANTGVLKAGQAERPTVTSLRERARELSSRNRERMQHIVKEHKAEQQKAQKEQEEQEEQEERIRNHEHEQHMPG